MPDVMARDALLRLADRYQLPRVRAGLEPVADGIAADLAALEGQLADLVDPNDPTAVAASARHLLASGGKRVRPMVCLLAARSFPPAQPPPSVLQLAIVAEAIHNATLLHDDVIDLGDTRRGKPASRLLFGNGASILGGDLLLVEGLAVVQASGIPALMPAMIDVLQRMVGAEALQLENRGRADLTVDEYFQVVDGKTASLFEWAMEAGARAAGADDEAIEAVRRYGHHVGYAFQLLDDLLDLTREPDAIGKNVLQDVGSGTVTFPVVLALQGRPELAARLAAMAAGEQDDRFVVDLLRAIDVSDAAGTSRRLIEEHTAAALTELGKIPVSAAGAALASVATALAERAR